MPTPTMIQNAYWEPLVKAFANPTLPTSWLKRLSDTEDATATPTAPPTCCAVLINPDARPASWCSMPASAAIETGMNENGSPKPTSRYPGSRSLQNEACTGICVYQSIPAIMATNPIAMIGFAPTFVTSACASPANRTALPAVATNVMPVFSAE